MPIIAVAVKKTGVDTVAVTGGVFFGYGLQHRHWYLGVEGELEDANADWAATQDPDGREFSVEKMETWGAALRGGYVVDNGRLLYARAGKVRTRFKAVGAKKRGPAAEASPEAKPAEAES
mgnify:CR=1 FL=1